MISAGKTPFQKPRRPASLYISATCRRQAGHHKHPSTLIHLRKRLDQLATMDATRHGQSIQGKYSPRLL